MRALRRVESALNRAVYTKRCLGRRPETTVSELYLLSDVIERSVTCEAAGIDTGAAGYGDRGEWEVRRALALGIRSLRLPYRLECRFRLNLEAGVAALSFGTVEPDVVAPREWCGDGGTRRTTRARRELRAARLACREAMVLAAMALSTSPRLHEAWVQAADVDGRPPSPGAPPAPPWQPSTSRAPASPPRGRARRPGRVRRRPRRAPPPRDAAFLHDRPAPLPPRGGATSPRHPGTP